MALIPTTQVSVSPEDYRRKMAYALLQQGSSGEPVQHWTQGLNRIAQGLLGGYQMYQDEQKQKQDEADQNAAYAKIVQTLQGGGAQPAPPMAGPAPTAPSPAAAALAKPTQVASIDPAASAPTREPVPEIPGVVRTNPDGSIAGNITSPTIPSRTAMALASPSAPITPTPVKAEAVAAAPAPTAPQMADARSKLIEGLLNSPSRADQKAGRALADMAVSQAMKPTDFEFKDRGDGTLIAINKHNPADVRVVQNNGQNTINFEANKAAAIEQAKRTGGIEYEAGKAGAVKRAELQAAKDIAAPENAKQAAASGDIVTTDIDRALKLVDNKGGTLPTTGGIGKAISHIGGTNAGDLSNLLGTIKTNVGFAELQRMRQASPTGGALGAISDRENEMLGQVKGSVEQSQSATQLKYNLKRLKNLTNDIVHGPGNGPAREILTPPKVSSIAEARKYPSGTEIILPDGSPGVVP